METKTIRAPKGDSDLKPEQEKLAYGMEDKFVKLQLTNFDVPGEVNLVALPDPMYPRAQRESLLHRVPHTILANNTLRWLCSEP